MNPTAIIGSNPVVSQTGSSKVQSAKNSKSSDSFSDIMNRNVTTNRATSNKTVNNKVTDFNSNNSVKKMSVDSSSESSQPKLEESIADTINSAATQITQAIQEQLEISDEEMEQLMAEMGITATDLLNQNVLNQFIVKASGADDISAALTDETLSNVLTELDATLADILEQNNLTTDVVENFSELMQQAEMIPEQVAAVPEEKSNPVKEQQNANADETTSDEPNVEVIVEKEVPTSKGTELKESYSDEQESAPNTAQTDSNLNTIINGLAGSSTKVETFRETVADIEQMRNIVTQVVDQIKVNIKSDSTSMELLLNPENLGRVNLTVVAKQGVLTAQIATENAMTKTALENQLQVLKDNLNEQGLKVEAVEVTVADMKFSSSNSASSSGEEKGQKGNRKKITLEESELMEQATTTDEELMNETVPEVGGSVNYTA
ncbi:flagellar hook-length control protein FliK [Lachnospiraceae bacterium KM106-2]|nr:flagellar hook-length control protein FliK [Lachnospiraceae bacterium KM106-2]